MIALPLVILCAVSSPESAEPEIQRAVELYRGFKVAEGVKVLGRALGKSQLPAHERARVYVYVAVGESNRGDDVAAKRSLEQAFTYDPTIALPDIAAPRLRALYEQLKPALPEAKVAPGSEQANPPTAIVPKQEPGDDSGITSPPPIDERKQAEPSLLRWWIAPAVAAVASAVIGGVLLQQAGSHYALLTTPMGSGPSLSSANADVIASQGKGLQVGGWISLSLTVVFVAIAFVVGILGA